MLSHKKCHKCHSYKSQLLKEVNHLSWHEGKTSNDLSGCTRKLNIFLFYCVISSLFPSLRGNVRSLYTKPSHRPFIAPFFIKTILRFQEKKVYETAMTVDIFFQMKTRTPFSFKLYTPRFGYQAIKNNVLLLRLLSYLIVESATIKNMGLNSPQNIDNSFT